MRLAHRYDVAKLKEGVIHVRVTRGSLSPGDNTIMSKEHMQPVEFRMPKQRVNSHLSHCVK